MGMRRFGRRSHFDLAIGHGSNDLAIAAGWLRIPAVNMFDYEFAVQQHNIGCRLARRVMTPDTIPPERLTRYGVGPETLRQFPGLKEEYYLADFEPDAGIIDRLGLDRERVIVVLRPPPDVSLYHRKANTLFPRVLAHLGHHDGVQAVVVAAHRGAADVDPRAPLSLARDPGRGDRRPEPDRARRPRRVGGRHDEPRGGRARHAGLHDVRWPSRRRATRR